MRSVPKQKQFKPFAKGPPANFFGPASKRHSKVSTSLRMSTATTTGPPFKTIDEKRELGFYQPPEAAQRHNSIHALKYNPLAASPRMQKKRNCRESNSNNCPHPFNNKMRYSSE